MRTDGTPSPHSTTFPTTSESVEATSQRLPGNATGNDRQVHQRAQARMAVDLPLRSPTTPRALPPPATDVGVGDGLLAGGLLPMTTYGQASTRTDESQAVNARQSEDRSRPSTSNATTQEKKSFAQSIGSRPGQHARPASLALPDRRSNGGALQDDEGGDASTQTEAKDTEPQTFLYVSTSDMTPSDASELAQKLGSPLMMFDDGSSPRRAPGSAPLFTHNTLSPVWSRHEPRSAGVQQTAFSPQPQTPMASLSAIAEDVVAPLPTLLSSARYAPDKPGKQEIVTTRPALQRTSQSAPNLPRLSSRVPESGSSFGLGVNLEGSSQRKIAESPVEEAGEMQEVEPGRIGMLFLSAMSSNTLTRLPASHRQSSERDSGQTHFEVSEPADPQSPLPSPDLFPTNGDFAHLTSRLGRRESNEAGLGTPIDRSPGVQRRSVGEVEAHHVSFTENYDQLYNDIIEGFKDGFANGAALSGESSPSLSGGFVDDRAPPRSSQASSSLSNRMPLERESRDRFMANSPRTPGVDERGTVYRMSDELSTPGFVPWQRTPPFGSPSAALFLPQETSVSLSNSAWPTQLPDSPPRLSNSPVDRTVDASPELPGLQPWERAEVLARRGTPTLPSPVKAVPPQSPSLGTPRQDSRQPREAPARALADLPGLASWERDAFRQQRMPELAPVVSEPALPVRQMSDDAFRRLQALGEARQAAEAKPELPVHTLSEDHLKRIQSRSNTGWLNKSSRSKTEPVKSRFGMGPLKALRQLIQPNGARGPTGGDAGPDDEQAPDKSTGFGKSGAR